MIWADRAAIGLWAIAEILTVLALAVISFMDKQVVPFAPAIAVLTGAGLVLWLVLRIVDWMIGGPAWRRRRAERHA